MEYVKDFLKLNSILPNNFTFPNVNKDLLIFPVYLIIYPCDFVYFNLSEPARSTNTIFPYFLNIVPY